MKWPLDDAFEGVNHIVWARSEVKKREAEKQQGSDALGQHYCYKMGQEAEEQQGSASKKEGGIETSH